MKLPALFRKFNVLNKQRAYCSSDSESDGRQRSHAYLPIFNELGCGTSLVDSESSALIPWQLVQTVTLSKARTPGEVCFEVMAEFHRDSLIFPVDNASDLLAAMELYLDGFNRTSAALEMEKMTAGGVHVIYRSPRYPDEVTK